jgi:hypothetical protein
MDESKDPLLGKKAAGDVDGKDEFVGQTKFQRWNGDTVFGINGRVVRFLVLALICILTFGSYFVYDIPGNNALVRLSLFVVVVVVVVVVVLYNKQNAYNCNSKTLFTS